jgi:DNA-directed RNA polymerase specialized sigma subunit
MEQIREHIEILNSAVEYGERINKNGSGGGYASDKIPRIIARIAELTDEMVSCALDYDIEVTIAEEAIESLPENAQKIARYRYIEGMPWKDVAEKAVYSLRQCYRIDEEIKRRHPMSPNNNL